MVVERAEKAALGLGGRGEESEGLVAVASEDDFIKCLVAVCDRGDGDAARRSGDARGGRVEADAIGEGCGERGEVALRTVFYRPPLMLSVQPEKTVVMKKSE